MPTGFGALRHDHVGAHIHRLSGLLKVGCLDDQRRAGLADGLGQRSRVTEGQHHGPGLCSSARSMVSTLIAQPWKPTPHGLSVPSATIGSSRASQAASPLPPPSRPSPPPLETAAASAPPADPPMGA